MLNSNNKIDKDIDVQHPSVTDREKYGSTSSTNPSDFTPNGTPSPNGHLTAYSSMKRKSRDSNAANGRRRPPRIYLNKFRVPIYIQLCAVICILTGLCVMVVAVTTVISPSLILRSLFVNFLILIVSQYTNDRQTLLDLQGNNLVTIAVLK